jgi:hypothetical protein
MAFRNRLSVFVCAALLAAVAACSGDPGPAGPAGPRGEPGDPAMGGGEGETDPSVSAVFPNRVFLSRTADVSISGFGTKWTNAAKVDFGAGVTVNSVVVASSTAIVANVSVTDSAATGVRDVTVTEGTETVAYKGAFKVESALGFKVQGSLAQGSLVAVEGTMNDPTTPLDSFTTEITVSDGLTAFVQGLDSYSAKLVVGVDVDAPAGAHEITVTSGFPTSYTYHYAFNVEARTATELQSGMDTTGTIAKPFDSALFKFTPAMGLQAVSLVTVSDNPDALPGFILVPPSGKIGEFITYSDRADFLSKTGEAYYAIYWDDTGVAPQDFTMTATAKDVTVATEAMQNESAMQAQSMDPLPYFLNSATLSAKTDQDWFKFNATAADLSQCLHVVTFAPPPTPDPNDVDPPQFADTMVEVLQSDGTTLLGSPSSDAGYHEDHFSAPITKEGVYYVKIYWSVNYAYDPTQTAYQALITTAECPPKEPSP